MVNLLLKRGADPEIAANNGFSHLYFAAATEDEDMASLLVSLGVPMDLNSAIYSQNQPMIPTFTDL